MWAWKLISGKPATVQSASVSGIGGGGSLENYGGDAAMADMRGGAFQRRARRRRTRTVGVVRRRRRRAHQSTVGVYVAAQRRAYRSRKTVARRHARLKTRVVGTQASTGKKIFQGHGGGRYTRGSRGNRNYI